MKKKAIIISIKGYKLTKKENELLVREKPWGLIIFKRNIKSWSQIKTLIKSIRNSTKDPKFPIMIDEEGGAVTRLNNLINFNFYNKFFGEIYKYDPKTSISSYGKYSRQIALILKLIGININTVPVLDVIRKNTNNIIGNRSFSSDPTVVKRLGEECIKSYRLERIGTVIKHIPGHGCSSLDSHIKMPKVKNTLKDLKNNDFFPFKLQKSFFAMTAHIKYLMLDNKNVATFSKKIISDIIRKEIGFKGILISDDISMKALRYDLITNAKKSLSAGCNLVLYCSGNYSDCSKLMKEIPFIDKFTQKKTSEFYKFLS